MSTNKLSHLTEWEKIYLEVTREKSHFEDNEIWLHFCKSLNSSIWVNDNDTFYTLDELKQLANDGMPNDNMPKQGEMIEVRWKGFDEWSRHKFIALYEWTVITEYHSMFNPVSWDEWRPLQKKTELTLAEIEEKLGIEKGSLIIK